MGVTTLPASPLGVLCLDLSSWGDRKEGFPVPQTDKLHAGFSRVSSVLSLFSMLLIKDSMSACLKVIFSSCVCCLSTGKVFFFLTFYFVLRYRRLTAVTV